MSFDSFCDAFQLKRGKPATKEQLQKAEEKLGVPLAKSAKNIYEIANGGKAKHELSELEFYSVKRALQYARVPRFFDAPWILWPQFENNDSNPLCICCKAPLTGYLVLMSHDDAPRIMFRSLESFFSAASEFIAAGEYLDIAELSSDFSGADRTKGDLTAANKLIVLAKKLTDANQTDALCFAADLLSDDQLDEIKALLDFDNAEAIDYITERLQRVQKVVGSKKAVKQVAKTKETFDGFVVRCGETLLAAGFSATVVQMYGKNTIRIDPGPVWLDMQFIYSARKRADFNEYFVELVRNATKRCRKR